MKQNQTTINFFHRLCARRVSLVFQLFQHTCYHNTNNTTHLAPSFSFSLQFFRVSGFVCLSMQNGRREKHELTVLDNTHLDCITKFNFKIICILCKKAVVLFTKPENVGG